MEVIKKVESREDYKKWLLDTHGIFCVKGFSEEPNTSFMPNTAKLALICEWLREEKEYFVEIEKDYFTGEFIVTTTGFKKCYYDCDETYNEAMATAIWIALKLIDKAQ